MAKAGSIQHKLLHGAEVHDTEVGEYKLSLQLG